MCDQLLNCGQKNLTTTILILESIQVFLHQIAICLCIENWRRDWDSRLPHTEARMDTHKVGADVYYLKDVDLAPRHLLV